MYIVPVLVNYSFVLWRSCVWRHTPGTVGDQHTGSFRKESCSVITFIMILYTHCVLVKISTQNDYTHQNITITQWEDGTPDNS